MRRGLHTLLLTLCAVSLYPATALAHTGVGLTTGFGSGFIHPMLGFDHLLAMVAVGLLAVQRGGKALWLLPTTFVSLMLVGGALGINGVHIPYVETGILASLLVLGVLLSTALRLPLVASTIVVGVFAIFHGHAHGSEISLSSAAVSYSIGFALATATLHLTGIMAGTMLKRVYMERIIRVAGGAIAVSGLYMALA